MTEPASHIGTVLVVDDEDHLRFVLHAHLGAAGFRVLQANDGEHGVEMAQQHQPDLIIMDITLPGIDGLTATRRLKSDARTASIPVIMLTARTRTEDLILGLEAGAQEYLCKPFEMSELLARVRTVHRLAVAHRQLEHFKQQLEREVERKTHRLDALYNYTRRLSRADTRDEILDLVVECVQATTGARRISLLMTDPAGRQLVCERSVGIEPEIVDEICVRSMEGIAGVVFHSGKTFVAEAVADPGLVERRYARDAFLSTPLISSSVQTNDGVLGVINATEKADESPFTQDEVECVRSIADAAALALNNVLRRQRLEHSVDVLLGTVGLLAEYRDEETTLHLKRVSQMARIMAEVLAEGSPYAERITPSFIHMLEQAAPLHDIGKVGVPDDILTKPGKLTDEEFQIMKTHTDIGRRVLSQALDPAFPVPLLSMCIDIAYCHHEKWDGSGYPRRIRGETIPLAARIVSLVDAYDAITSRRRYSAPRTHEQAVDIIRSEAGRHFDPVLVEAFLTQHDRFAGVRAEYSEPATEESVDMLT